MSQIVNSSAGRSRYADAFSQFVRASLGIRESLAVIGGLYGAEACRYPAATIFGAQALVISISPVVSLARQPDMVGDAPNALRAY